MMRVFVVVVAALLLAASANAASDSIDLLCPDSAVEAGTSFAIDIQAVVDGGTDAENENQVNVRLDDGQEESTTLSAGLAQVTFSGAAEGEHTASVVDYESSGVEQGSCDFFAYAEEEVTCQVVTEKLVTFSSAADSLFSGSSPVATSAGAAARGVTTVTVTLRSNSDHPSASGALNTLMDDVESGSVLAEAGAISCGGDATSNGCQDCVPSPTESNALCAESSTAGVFECVDPCSYSDDGGCTDGDDIMCSSDTGSIVCSDPCDAVPCADTEVCTPDATAGATKAACNDPCQTNNGGCDTPPLVECSAGREDDTTGVVTCLNPCNTDNGGCGDDEQCTVSTSSEVECLRNPCESGNGGCTTAPNTLCAAPDDFADAASCVNPCDDTEANTCDECDECTAAQGGLVSCVGPCEVGNGGCDDSLVCNVGESCQADCLDPCEPNPCDEAPLIGCTSAQGGAVTCINPCSVNNGDCPSGSTCDASSGAIVCAHPCDALDCGDEQVCCLSGSGVPGCSGPCDCPAYRAQQGCPPANIAECTADGHTLTCELFGDPCDDNNGGCDNDNLCTWSETPGDPAECFDLCSVTSSCGFYECEFSAQAGDQQVRCVNPCDKNGGQGSCSNSERCVFDGSGPATCEEVCVVEPCQEFYLCDYFPGTGRTCTNPCDTSMNTCSADQACELSAEGDQNNVLCAAASDVCTPTCQNGGVCNEARECDCTSTQFTGPACTIVSGCTNPKASNYAAAASIDDGSCIIEGCMDPTALNYDSDPEINTPTHCYFPIFGCMESDNPMYDASAEVQRPGDCVKVGCTESSAINYDPTATSNSGCLYGQVGCTTVGADNYSSANTVSCNNCCLFGGCTDSAAANYDTGANIDDKSCQPFVNRCLDPTAFNYKASDLNIKNVRADLTKCIYRGCKTVGALNYCSKCTVSNVNACNFAISGCMIEGNPKFRPDATVADNTKCQFRGCMDPAADNYDSSANTAGACIFSIKACTDPTATNRLVSTDPSIKIVSTPSMCRYKGCTDTNAFNYDSKASVLDNSCQFKFVKGTLFVQAQLRNCQIKSANGEIGKNAAHKSDQGGKFSIQYGKSAGTLKTIYTPPSTTCRNPANPSNNVMRLLRIEMPVIFEALTPISSIFSAAEGDSLSNGEMDSLYEYCEVDAQVTDMTKKVPQSGTKYMFCTLFALHIGAAVTVMAEILGHAMTDADYMAGWRALAQRVYAGGNSAAADYLNVGSVKQLMEAAADLMGLLPSDFFFTLISQAIVNNMAVSTGFSRRSRALSSNSITSSGGLEAAITTTKAAVAGEITEEEAEAQTSTAGMEAAQEATAAESNVVEGCTSSAATNFNEEATVDDDSCIIKGCTDEKALNFNALATVNDAARCVFPPVGCTDTTANNFDSFAVVSDDSSCTYTVRGCTNSLAENFNGLATADDNTCVFSVVGCTDEEADNFDSEATVTEEGSCTYANVVGCTDSSALNFRPAANVDSGLCTFLIVGCSDPDATNFVEGATESADAGEEGACEYAAVEGCTDSAASNFDPEATEDDGSCIVRVAGCTNAAATNFNSAANLNDGSCTFAVTGCTNPAAVNFNSNADSDDGTCVIQVLGCSDQLALNFDSAATEDDGSCTYAVQGCTDSTASNYNPSATVDNLTCEFLVFGCTDSTALNFDSNANTQDAGSCVAAVPGCTDSTASNFNPVANSDNGSCAFEVPGCMNEAALNFNSAATVSDGTCQFAVEAGCTDSFAENYDPTAGFDDGTCRFTDNCHAEACLDGETCLDAVGSFVCTDVLPVIREAEQPDDVISFVCDASYQFLLDDVDGGVAAFTAGMAATVNAADGTAYTAANIVVVALSRVDHGTATSFFVSASSDDAAQNAVATASALAALMARGNVQLSVDMGCVVSLVQGVPNPLPDVPLVAPGGIYFVDVDGAEGEVGGSLTIIAPLDLDDVVFYNIYWGSSSTATAGMIGVPVLRGPGDMTVTVPKGTAIPDGVTHLIVFTYNLAGPGKSVSTPLVDYVCSGASWLVPEESWAYAASSEAANHPKENAVDGDTRTAWETTSDSDEWIAFDLGMYYSITRVRIVAFNDGVRNAVLQTSDDASGPWVDVKAFTVPLQTEFTAIFDDVTARYFRLFVESSDEVEIGLAEFGFYGEAATPSMLPSAGFVATTSSNAHDAARTVDGDVDTTWEATGSSRQWVSIALGLEYTVSSVTVQFPAGAVRTGRLEYTRVTKPLDWKTDQSFVVADTDTSITLTLSRSTYALRVYVMSSADDLTPIAVTEIMVYGHQNTMQVVDSSAFFSNPNTAASTGVESLSNLFDGNPSTAWLSSGTTDQWVNIYFGTVVYVSEVRLTQVGNQARGGNIARRNQGLTAWIKEASFQGIQQIAPFTAGAVVIRVPFTSAAFTAAIRVNVRNSFGAVNIAIADIAVVGEVSGAAWLSNDNVEITRSTAAATVGRPATAVLDASTSTYYQSAQSTNTFLAFDLGAVHTLEAVRVVAKRNRVGTVHIQKPAPSAAGTWYSVQTYTFEDETDVTIQFAPVADRYWRIFIENSSADNPNYKIAVQAVAFFGSGPVSFSALASQTAWVQQTSSESPGFEAVMAFDREAATSWQAETGSASVTLNLGSVHALNQIRVTPVLDGVRNAKLERWDTIEQAWYIVRAFTVPNSADPFLASFATVSSQVWRFSVTSTYNSARVQVTAITLFSSDESNCAFLRRR